MPASLVGSFIIFLVTGIYSMCFGKKIDYFPEEAINYIVLAAIVLTGCYYFYFELFNETNEKLQSELINKSRLEWIIRVINQVILLSLWFTLEKDITLFFWFFFLLYVSFVIWDIITWDLFKNHYLVIIDFFGLIISVFFLLVDGLHKKQISIVSHQPDPLIIGISTNLFSFIVGILTTIFIISILIGWILIRFNPFQKELWSRPSIR